MPSRTYIQMILKLHNAGKIYLTEASLRKLRKYNTVIKNHPEAIEEIVQRRVKLISYAKDILHNEDIMIVHLVKIEEAILDSMFMEELIEPPVFDRFDFGRNFHRIAMGFQPVINNAVVKIDLGGKDESVN